jgi:hypothetical protein
MKATLILISFCVMTASSAQTNAVPESWDRYYPGIRVGVGLQNSLFAEIGVSFQRFEYKATHGFTVSTAYASYEWNAANRIPVYGIKAGAEFISNGGGGGLEFKYLKYGKKEKVIITPKLGLGLGFINLFYGYNLFTSEIPPDPGRHQFSLIANTSILFRQLMIGRTSEVDN